MARGELQFLVGNQEGGLRRTAIKYTSSEYGFGSCGNSVNHSVNAGAILEPMKLAVKA